MWFLFLHHTNRCLHIEVNLTVIVNHQAKLKKRIKIKLDYFAKFLKFDIFDNIEIINLFSCDKTFDF